LKQLSKKSVIILICVVLFIAIVLGASVARAYSVDKICGGVTAGGVSISKLSVPKAEEKLRENLHEELFDTPVHLVLGDVEKSVKPSDFLAAYDYKKTAEKAIAYGHEGSFLQRIGQTLRTFFIKKNIEMEISYDEAAFADIMENLMTGVGEKVQEHIWEIQDDVLLVTTGHPGLLPDESSVAEAILQAIRDGEYDEKIIFEKESRNPAQLSAETLYSLVSSVASNASYAIENGKVVMHPHTLGISFDKVKAQEIIDLHDGFGVTFEIPLKIEEPEVTLEDIEEKLFSSIIGEYTTTFKTSDVGRTKNIVLATNKINGTILAPDEIFSYNGVVGERSYSEGFQDAKVYVNGETVDGIGGGICQVSSTLFNAVVFANLEIVERVNHQLTVSYVPLGRDATVDYGNIDFRFKNNTGYPLKIVCSAEGGKMYMAIYGYKEDKSEKISFETVTIGHTAPPERKVDDPTLPLGEEKVESEGSSGYVVDTYKVIQKDGESTERVYLCRSNYRGNLRVIRVGTGEAVPSPSPTEGTEPSPSPTESIEPTPQITPAITTAPEPSPSTPTVFDPITEAPQETPVETDNSAVSENGL